MTSSPAAVSVPARADWPEPPPQTEAGRELTELVVGVFRLHARLMDAAQRLASAGGITAAWWQVLGGVLDEPRTIADIGRRMGVTRQAVLRIADLLVDSGLAEYQANPAHQRAKLVRCTEAGYWAIRQVAVAQHPWADRVAEQLGADDLRSGLRTVQRLTAVLDGGPSGPVGAV